MTKKQPTFEDSIGKLEALVDALEAGDMPLDKAIDAFENGHKLVAECKGQLEQARMRVEKIVENAGKNAQGAISTVPLDEEEIS